MPFRNSKLTYLLKDSLGGTASTWVVACVSPRTDDAEETVNTLRFAQRAKSVRTVPAVEVLPTQCACDRRIWRRRPLGESLAALLWRWQPQGSFTRLY